MPFSDGGDSDDKIEGSSPENEDEGDSDQLSDDVTVRTMTPNQTKTRVLMPLIQRDPPQFRIHSM